MRDYETKKRGKTSENFLFFFFINCAYDLHIHILNRFARIAEQGNKLNLGDEGVRKR